MKDVNIYRYGKNLRFTFCFIPEPHLVVTVNEKESMSLSLPLFFDLLRILNSFVSVQQKTLSGMVGAPVKTIGDKAYQEIKPETDQYEMFEVTEKAE